MKHFKNVGILCLSTSFLTAVFYIASVALFHLQPIGTYKGYYNNITTEEIIIDILIGILILLSLLSLWLNKEIKIKVTSFFLTTGYLLAFLFMVYHTD